MSRGSRGSVLPRLARDAAGVSLVRLDLPRTASAAGRLARARRVRAGIARAAATDVVARRRSGGKLPRRAADAGALSSVRLIPPVLAVSARALARAGLVLSGVARGAVRRSAIRKLARRTVPAGRTSSRARVRARRARVFLVRAERIGPPAVVAGVTVAAAA